MAPVPLPERQIVVAPMPTSAPQRRKGGGGRAQEAVVRGLPTRLHHAGQRQRQPGQETRQELEGQGKTRRVCVPETVQGRGTLA